MKKFFLSVPNGTVSSDWAALLLRVGFGIVMFTIGYEKIMNFDTLKIKFVDFMGLGSTLSLSLAIFSEFFCSLLLIFGLFTRLATLPLLITTLVIFSVHNWEIFGKEGFATTFFVAYIVILILGSGTYSLDALIFKKQIEK